MTAIPLSYEGARFVVAAAQFYKRDVGDVLRRRGGTCIKARYQAAAAAQASGLLHSRMIAEYLKLSSNGVSRWARSREIQKIVDIAVGIKPEDAMQIVRDAL